MPALLSRAGGGLQLPAMNPQNLLVELFVEELPPKALPALGESFARTLAASLQSQGLAAADREPTPYASPRRLAVLVPAVAAKAADKAVAQKLMPVAVGLDADGKPTPALLKKLGALGLDAGAAPRLRREGEGKAETLFIDTVGASFPVDVIRSVQPSSPGGGDYSFLLEQRGDVDTPPSNPFE